MKDGNCNTWKSLGWESWAFLAEKCYGVEKSGVTSQSAGRIAC
jgi:hypothetical protein